MLQYWDIPIPPLNAKVKQKKHKNTTEAAVRIPRHCGGVAVASASLPMAFCVTDILPTTRERDVPSTARPRGPHTTGGDHCAKYLRESTYFCRECAVLPTPG
jgi:hypothetical protein